MSNEESSLVPESEPFLLPENDLTHPGDIICPFPSSPESLNSESSITNQNASTTDVKYESPKH
jgi:hypothetical protein